MVQATGINNPELISPHTVSGHVTDEVGPLRESAFLLNLNPRG